MPDAVLWYMLYMYYLVEASQQTYEMFEQFVYIFVIPPRLWGSLWAKLMSPSSLNLQHLAWCLAHNECIVKYLRMSQSKMSLTQRELAVNAGEREGRKLCQRTFPSIFQRDALKWEEGIVWLYRESWGRRAETGHGTQTTAWFMVVVANLNMGVPHGADTMHACVCILQPPMSVFCHCHR